VRTFVPVYSRRPTPLHTARAGVTMAFCAAIGLAALVYESPLVLGAAVAGTVAAGVAAGVAGELWRGARIALPVAVLMAIVNGLVSREGETLLVRGGEVFGWRLDITLEALAFGAIAGLRVVALVLALALFTATVDPDETLRLFRRFSYRSALTASLATRLVPVLARDAARMNDAARCRPTRPPRAAAARAALRGALDRAVDVAAALELRGYAGARAPARARRLWSRHDLRVALAAAAIAALAIGARVAGTGGFEAYPELSVVAGTGEAALCVGLALLPLAPFAGSSARLGVARA
jgi:energy-coupling factor transport system permease protein